jgi:very-short-patch-repair endonuclease
MPEERAKDGGMPEAWRETTAEAAFRTCWTVCAPDAPEPEREYRFHPSRRWRFDFAWPAQRVAVECEGGVWVKGRHVRGQGFIRDCWKYSNAAALGWLVLRCTPKMLHEDGAGFVELVRQALRGKAQSVTGNVTK